MTGLLGGADCPDLGFVGDSGQAGFELYYEKADITNMMEANCQLRI
jgi:hypothetical protein